MNKDEPPKFSKRLKCHFSQEDKKNFYTQWKASGLRRAALCRKNDLTPSVFGKGCRRLDLQKQTQPSRSNWIPVIEKEIPTRTKKGCLTIPANVTNLLLLVLFLRVEIP